MTPPPSLRRAPRGAGLIAMAAAFLAINACSGATASPGGDVFRVEIEACTGVSHQRATGWAIGSELVATAAHTVESARRVVLRTVDDTELTSEIVYLDPDRDIALVAVDASLTRVFELGDAAADDQVTIPTYADSDGLEIKEATVLRSVTATLDGEGSRRAIELAASIEQGDSGAPVVDGDGRVVGMVFASSRRDDRGWAVSATELEAAIAVLSDDGYEPPPSRCGG